MEYRIGNKFLTVITNPKMGETEKLKSCGASLFLRERSKRSRSVFLCPLQTSFIKNLILTFNLHTSDLHNLLQFCIKRDRFNASIMRECDYYRDNEDVPTPIDKMGDFAKGMRHAQKVSLYASMHIPRFGLFLDRGIGKSKVIIDNITLRLAYNQISKILIVCPRLNISNTWLPEIELHSKVRNLPITTIVGDKDDKVGYLLNEKREMYIHIMTYAAMRDYADKMGTYDILIFDESKNIAGDSQQSLSAFQLSARSNYVIEATGTVNTLKSMKDVFYQYRTLDLGATYGLKYANFQEDYFLDVGKHFPIWVLKRGSLETIRSLMYRRAISYLKSECMDLPPRTIKDIKIKPNSFQALFTKAFADGLNLMMPEMEIKKFLESNGISYQKEAEAINEAIPFSKISKLQEITSGFYKSFTVKNKLIEFKSTKIDALLDTISTIKDEKIIIWCRFTRDISRLSKVLKKLKVKSYQVHGKKDEIKKWQKSKTVNVLLGMESVGQGFTLNEAAYMIYFSYDYSLDHWNQSIDRNYRGGQTRNTTVYILQVINSVDQAVISALNSNETFSKKLTDYQLRKIAQGN